MSNPIVAAKEIVTRWSQANGDVARDIPANVIASLQGYIAEAIINERQDISVRFPNETKQAGPQHRYLIVFDGKYYYARHIRTIAHDADRDEMIYRCDYSIAGPVLTFAEVAKEAEKGRIV